MRRGRGIWGNEKMVFQVSLCVVLAFALTACGEDGGGGAAVLGTNGENIGGVISDDNGSPIEGATVSLVGASPAVTTTTNASGQWSLVAPAGGSLEAPEEAPQIVARADGHWGGSVRRYLSDGQMIDDIDLNLVPDSIVAEVGTTLGRTVSKSTAIVIVDIHVDGSNAGGESATLSVASDPPFTFDTNDEPVLSATILAGEETELVFTNVPPGGFEVMPAGNGNLTDCGYEFAFSTQGFTVAIAGVITRSQVFCGAL